MIWQLAPGVRSEAFSRGPTVREQAAVARQECEAERRMAVSALASARGEGWGPDTPYEEQLMECAALRVAGCTNGEIAGLFGITPQAVSRRLLTHPDEAMWTALFSLVSFEVLLAMPGRALTAGGRGGCSPIPAPRRAEAAGSLVSDDRLPSDHGTVRAPGPHD